MLTVKEAIQTQRSIRRLHLGLTSDEVIYELEETMLKPHASTSA